MKGNVTSRPAALKDLQEAYEWYEEKRAGLGGEFLLVVAESMLLLEESAMHFPLY